MWRRFLAFVAIFAYFAAMPSTLAAAVTCEDQLQHTFATSHDNSKIAAAVVQSVLLLRENGKLSDVDLHTLAIALAESPNGILPDQKFWVNHSSTEWNLARELLKVIATKIATRTKNDSLITQLQSAWQQLSRKIAHSISATEAIQSLVSATTLREVEFNHLSYASFSGSKIRQFKNGEQTLITFQNDFGNSYLFAVDPVLGTRQIDLRAVSAKFIGNGALITDTSPPDLQFHLLDFSDPTLPKKLNINAHLNNAAIQKFLQLQTLQSIRCHVALGPNKILFMTYKSNNCDDNIFYIDTKSLTSVDLIPRTGKHQVRHPRGMVALPGERVFVWGEDNSVGLIDVSAASTANEAKSYWTPKELNPYTSESQVSSAILLSNGQVVTRDYNGTLTLWTTPPNQHPIPTTLLANQNIKSIGEASPNGNGLQDFFEVAPGELLSIGEQILYWDLRNPEARTAELIPLGRPESDSDRKAEFQSWVQTESGNIFSYSKHSGLILFTPQPGQMPAAKSVILDSGGGAPAVIAPLGDHEALVFFYKSQKVYYVDFSGEEPVARKVDDLLRRTVFGSPNILHAITLLDKFILLLTYEGALLEFNIADLKILMEGK